MFTTSSADRSARDPWAAPTPTREPSLTDSQTWGHAVAQVAPQAEFAAPWAGFNFEAVRRENEARNARRQAEARVEAARYPEHGRGGVVLVTTLDITDNVAEGVADALDGHPFSKRLGRFVGYGEGFDYAQANREDAIEDREADGYTFALGLYFDWAAA